MSPREDQIREMEDLLQPNILTTSAWEQALPDEVK